MVVGTLAISNLMFLGAEVRGSQDAHERYSSLGQYAQGLHKHDAADPLTLQPIVTTTSETTSIAHPTASDTVQDARIDEQELRELQGTFAMLCAPIKD